jgi:hypothetical protein
MTDFLNNRGNYIVRSPYVHYLDTNGDGTGNYHAVGDYSITPTNFFFAPTAGETVEVTKLMVHISDKGLFDVDGYGAIAAGLTVGVAITVERLGVTVLELTNGAPIKNNADLSHLNTDYRLTNFSSNYGSSIVSLDAAAFQTSLLMHGDLGDKLIVTLNDDFTGLDDHHFIMYGKK